MEFVYLYDFASRIVILFFSLEGLKPLLRLKTLDGFIYAESDPVTVALEQNVLLGTVLEWEICPLARRYEEMCDHMKQGKKLTVIIDCEKCKNYKNAIMLSSY